MVLCCSSAMGPLGDAKACSCVWQTGPSSGSVLPEDELRPWLEGGVIPAVWEWSEFQKGAASYPCPQLPPRWW